MRGQGHSKPHKQMTWTSVSPSIYALKTGRRRVQPSKEWHSRWGHNINWLELTRSNTADKSTSTWASVYAPNTSAKWHTHAMTAPRPSTKDQKVGGDPILGPLSRNSRNNPPTSLAYEITQPINRPSIFQGLSPEVAHPLVYGVSPWINLLSLYYDLILNSCLHEAKNPPLAAIPRTRLIWDVSILSPTHSLSWYALMPLPQPCLWLHRRWSLFMTIWPRRKKSKAWTSLVVQGLRLYASTAGSAGLIPGPGSSTCHLMWQKKKKKAWFAYRSKWCVGASWKRTAAALQPHPRVILKDGTKGKIPLTLAVNRNVGKVGIYMDLRH